MRVTFDDKLDYDELTIRLSVRRRDGSLGRGNKHIRHNEESILLSQAI
jgi:hypothetical protein